VLLTEKAAMAGAKAGIADENSAKQPTTAANRHVNCKAPFLSALQSPQRLCRGPLPAS